MIRPFFRGLFQLSAWTSGIVRFGLVVVAMFASIKWAPEQQSLLLLLGSCTVLPGALAVLNYMGFNIFSRLLFSQPYGSEKYRKSVRNSGLFALAAGAILAYVGHHQIEFLMPEFLRNLAN